MMTEPNVKLIRADLKKHNNELVQFLTSHFAANPLNTLLPLPQPELGWFMEVMASGNLTVLAFHENELVGCRTGKIVPYRQLLEEQQAPLPFDDYHENLNRSLKCENDMAAVDLSQYGVNENSKVYDATALCVSTTMRRLKLGSRLIEESMNMARANGAEFYLVHVVSSYAKRAFEKLQFETAKEIFFEQYFAHQPDILSRMESQHNVASFMIKRL